MNSQGEENAPTSCVSPRRRLIDLYEANFDDVYRFCLARTGDPATADDATAEAFLAAARTIGDDERAPIDRAWLFVVAKRRIIDLWRADDRHARRVDRLRNERSGPAEVDPLRSERAERVLEALVSLPPRQRAALVLRYLEECSVAEVADTLDCEYRAAESLLARGRRGFARAWQSQRNSMEHLGSNR